MSRFHWRATKSGQAILGYRYGTARVSKRLTDETAACFRARYCTNVQQERRDSNPERRFWRPKCYPVTPRSFDKAHLSRRQESNLLATRSHNSFTDSVVPKLAGAARKV